MFMRLEPFAHVWNKELLIATCGEWTAYFNNSHYGTDLSGIGHLAKRLGCEVLSLRLCDDLAVRHMNGVDFTLYGPRDTEWLNVTRHVGWLGERPALGQQGAPLSFERVDAYLARRVRDHFTKDLVLEYAAAMGARPLDASFYRSEGVLLTQPPWDKVQWLTFGEWRDKHLAAGNQRAAPAPLRGPPSYLRGRARKAATDGPAALLADAETALDTSWFALAVACVECSWKAIAWDDETA
jgi:hypothetical protein